MPNLLKELLRSNVIFYCRAWAETVAFYRERIGLPVAFENEWFVEFQLGDNSYLSIANAARATIQDVGGQGITLTWQVADLDGAWEALQGQGVEVTAIKERWNARVFYCFDPEGHRIEFWAEVAG